MSDPPNRQVTARHVVVLAAAAVAFVLGLQVLSAIVTPLDDALGYVPLVIVGLVAVTLLVLYRALRPRR
jgi:hypothetical protein